MSTVHWRISVGVTALDWEMAASDEETGTEIVIPDWDFCDRLTDIRMVALGSSFEELTPNHSLVGLNTQEEWGLSRGVHLDLTLSPSGLMVHEYLHSDEKLQFYMTYRYLYHRGPQRIPLEDVLTVPGAAPHVGDTVEVSLPWQQDRMHGEILAAQHYPILRDGSAEDLKEARASVA